MMHPYLKYQSPKVLGPTGIVQVKSFSKLGQSPRSRSLGQTWYQRKGLFMMHLFLWYQKKP
jgi:hypothetical protein